MEFSGASLVQQFRTLSEELCSIVEKEGLVIRPYNSENLPYFQQLGVPEQESVVENLQTYNRICHRVHKEGRSLEDSLFFLKKAIEEYGFEYDGLPMVSLRDEDLLEIYSLRNLQLFRNINFFEYASYTIEDLHCRPWTHLYQRDPKITERLMRMLEPVYRGVRDPIIVDVEEHLLVERASLERLAVYVKVLWAVPLVRNNKVEAYVVAGRCRPYQEH